MTVSGWAAVISGLVGLYAVALFFGGAIAHRRETQVVSIGVAALTALHVGVAAVAGPIVDAVALLAYLLGTTYWASQYAETPEGGSAVWG